MPGEVDFRRWFDELELRDPALFQELSRRLKARRQAAAGALTPESAAEIPPGLESTDVTLETIVRDGRPALLIRSDKIDIRDAVVEASARIVVERLLAAAPELEAQLPRVGRIDVSNYAGTATYLGTGWLVDRDIVVTNRHVAELIARREGGEIHFRSGRFGETLAVSLDFRHEQGLDAKLTAPVLRVVWIEPDPNAADFALLEVGRRSDAVQPGWIELADGNAEPDAPVAVIGYPARAPASVIPDQAWMDRIYGATYDVKRIAPGMMGANSRGWATHDCTTLGGNSGSVVVNMSGKAVGLHFAGQYMLANYAVPASQVRRYLKDRPWHLRPATPAEPPPVAESDAAADRGSVTITVPLTLTVTLGEPLIARAAATPTAGASTLQPLAKPSAGASAGANAALALPPSGLPVGAAARALRLALAGEAAGVLAVRAGHLLAGGRLTNGECLVVAADPERIDAVRAMVPAEHGGFPVEVRAASLRDQLASHAEVSEEAVTSVAYDDAHRIGSGFSFDWVDEEMTVVLHVGPERSWAVLSEFLAQTRGELVSSMYEFHAAHIADALQEDLARGARLKLVLARQSRDPGTGRIARGDFNRQQTFEQWENDYRERFERIFVPTGAQGLVATSYHIKVTVRDEETIWLSSGNWKRTSQPLIDAAHQDDPSVTGRAGNREWHVVLANANLARRLRNHILADFEQSLELSGTREAVKEVDVPAALLEGVELEAAPARVVEPRTIHRRLRVKPLLTPDRQGEIYSEAVLDLIRSARRQLVMQNQYISISSGAGGYLEQLVNALIEKSREIEDCRIVLRSGDGFLDDASELKRRGLDIDRCLRRLSNTHTKGIIADGERALVGSHNWSQLGVTLNRDASLIFEDREVAQYFLDVFELDWNRATELAEEAAIPAITAAAQAPRLAAGAEPPAGFVRMNLADYLEG